MIIKAIPIALALLAAPLAGAMADEASYTAGDVLNFFAAPSGQPLTRSICVGTAEQCGVAQPQQRPLNFNLMVNFEKNSAKLTPAAKANLQEFSKALKDPRLASATFAVDGYTDASGSEEYNLR